MGKRIASSSSLRLLVHQRDFGLVWTAGLISMIGDWVLWVVLPIRVYELTGSSLATAGLVASLVGPRIVFGSFAGVFVDRWDRRRTMMIASVLQAAAIVPLLLVDARGTIWIAYPVMALAATLSTFSEPAENAFLPRLVPETELVQANALNALNNNLARLVGPALGGLLYLGGGLTLVTVADAATFLGAALLLALVRVGGKADRAEHGADEPTTPGGALARMGHEWVEGLRSIRRSRPVSVILVVSGATAIGEGIFSVMFLIWVTQALSGGVPQLGWFMSAQAVGGLLGALVIGSFARRFTPERLFGCGLLAFGILDLLLFNYPLVLSGIALGLVLIVLVGIPSVAASSGGQTLLQREVPDRYRGRVFAALGTTSAALMLVATLAAGVVGETVGPIAMLNIQGAAYVVSGVVVLVLLAPLRLAQEHGRGAGQSRSTSATSTVSASSGEKPQGPGLPG
jgi:MFS family permease